MKSGHDSAGRRGTPTIQRSILLLVVVSLRSEAEVIVQVPHAYRTQGVTLHSNSFKRSRKGTLLLQRTSFDLKNAAQAEAKRLANSAAWYSVVDSLRPK